MLARRLRIHGRVQGVFYRQWTINTATGLGLVGWVRNCSDGTVEALAQGESQAVESLIEAARHGPPMAEVTRVEVAEVEPVDLQGFTKRDTV